MTNRALLALALLAAGSALLSRRPAADDAEPPLVVCAPEASEGLPPDLAAARLQVLRVGSFPEARGPRRLWIAARVLYPEAVAGRPPPLVPRPPRLLSRTDVTGARVAPAHLYAASDPFAGALSLWIRALPGEERRLGELRIEVPVTRVRCWRSATVRSERGEMAHGEFPLASVWIHASAVSPRTQVDGRVIPRVPLDADPAWQRYRAAFAEDGAPFPCLEFRDADGPLPAPVVVSDESGVYECIWWKDGRGETPIAWPVTASLHLPGTPADAETFPLRFVLPPTRPR